MTQRVTDEELAEWERLAGEACDFWETTPLRGPHAEFRRAFGPHAARRLIEEVRRLRAELNEWEQGAIEQSERD